LLTVRNNSYCVYFMILWIYGYMLY
jgi:hypothetical protein